MSLDGVARGPPAQRAASRRNPARLAFGVVALGGRGSPEAPGRRGSVCYDPGVARTATIAGRIGGAALIAWAAAACAAGATPAGTGAPGRESPRPGSDAGAVEAKREPPAAPTRPPVAFLDEREPPGGAGADPTTYDRVAARVFAFSDSQLHYLFGKRTFAQSPFADILVEVAVRPAALDDGSDLLLRAFLTDWRRRWRDHTPVFLGDAADLSCDQELAAFFDVLATAGLRTLLAVTSNHDGFFVGNYTSKDDVDGALQITDMPNDWTRACSEPESFDDHRLTKGRAVAALAARLPRAPAWATDARTGDGGPTDYADAHLYYVRPLGGADPGVAPAWGVFLDTVDYRAFDVTASQGAGTVGAVSREQLRFLDRAMFEARVAGDVSAFVVFAHYPVSALDPASRDRVLRFLETHPRIVAYVAAHEHLSRERALALPDGRSIPELLVGSTTDFPQEARRIEVRVDRAGRAAVASWRLRLAADRLCADVPPLPATATGYTGYRIRRDDIGIADIGTLDKLLVWAGLDDLADTRAVQAIGALLVENELVRAWAELYAHSPLAAQIDRSRLDAILDDRYAVGDDVAALRPYLTGRAAGGGTRYDAWHDPVVARRLAVAQRAFHRFGPHARTFRELRKLRMATPAAYHYFLCHAAHASVAEQRSRRTVRGVIYVR